MILALDLSLTCTGVVVLAPNGYTRTWTISTQPGPLGARLRFLYEEIQHLLRAHPIDLIVLEGPSFGSKNGLLSAGEVRATFELAVWHFGRIPTLEIPPGTLKQYATGRGNAGKDEVLVAAVTRLGYEGHNNNVSDALWLAQIGAATLGWDTAIPVPQTHTKALTKLRKQTVAA